jgi:hypothetical protein
VVDRLGTLTAGEAVGGPSRELFAAPPVGQPGRVVQGPDGLVVEYVRRSSSEPTLLVLPASRPPSFADGVVRLEALLAAEDPRAGYALYVRRTPDGGSGYGLWVRPRDRSLQFWREIRSARNELAQIRTEALLPDRANQIVLVAEGGRFEAFVNGHLALAASDDTFAAGWLGLAVDVGSGGSPAEVRVAVSQFQVFGLRQSAG